MRAWHSCYRKGHSMGQNLRWRGEGMMRYILTNFLHWWKHDILPDQCFSKCCLPSSPIFWTFGSVSFATLKSCFYNNMKASCAKRTSMYHPHRPGVHATWSIKVASHFKHFITKSHCKGQKLHLEQSYHQSCLKFKRRTPRSPVIHSKALVLV